MSNEIESIEVCAKHTIDKFDKDDWSKLPRHDLDELFWSFDTIRRELRPSVLSGPNARRNLGEYLHYCRMCAKVASAIECLALDRGLDGNEAVAACWAAYALVLFSSPAEDFTASTAKQADSFFRLLVGHPEAAEDRGLGAVVEQVGAVAGDSVFYKLFKLRQSRREREAALDAIQKKRVEDGIKLHPIKVWHEESDRIVATCDAIELLSHVWTAETPEKACEAATDWFKACRAPAYEVFAGAGFHVVKAERDDAHCAVRLVLGRTPGFRVGLALRRINLVKYV